uniref:Lipid-binding serum glycoprotein C-terminal domain-containing protein n=1 Tax=Monopterus albus TaxID=43700 RepID=A0A3Q3JR06_MONAL
MTSCIFALLFFTSLFSSIAAIEPADFKLRLTDRSLNMLRDQAVAILQELVNRPFESFQRSICTIQQFTFTQLVVNQADLRFRENSGFQLVIQNLVVTATFDRQLDLHIIQDRGSSVFEAGGVNVNIEVSLIRTEQGHLRVAIPDCQASADKMQLLSTGTLSLVWNIVQPCLRHFFGVLFCPAVNRFGLPRVNQMLDTIPMSAEVFPGLGINLLYSVTRDVQVTATTLDLSFKGLVYQQGEDIAAVNTGVDPVFSETNLMAYVGVSEFFLNKIATSLYNAGALKKKYEGVPSRFARSAVRFLQFFRQPWHLFNNLATEVGLTELPVLTITQHDGLTIRVRVRVRAVSTPAAREPSVITSVSAICQVSGKPGIQGNLLTLPHQDVRCSIVTKNAVRDVLVRPLNTKLSDSLSDFLGGCFGQALPVPLPQGVIFTQGMVTYHDGFMVVAGDLNFTPTGRRNIETAFGR